jgi:hypothetical protein
MKPMVCIMQLYDKSIYLVGGPEGDRHVPAHDSSSKYHIIDGPLIVADKPGVKDLTAKLGPLIKELGERKVFLALLACYWLAPCCDDLGHLVNYREQGYLPRLNNSISALRDCIRDSLYTRRISN